ncbi:MAG: endonuclease/exonuclease/phosphatase family protein [Promethearchaeota archaeon]
MPYSITISGIIIGIEIQFLILILNISSNISWNINKIVPTFLFITLLVLFDYFLFLPKKLRQVKIDTKDSSSKMGKKKLSYFHFIILGILFILCMIWILNPMALAAYDIFDLVKNDLYGFYVPIWYYNSYGFSFYVIIIIGCLIGSYFLSNVIFNYLSQKNQRILLAITIIICSISNIFAFFFLEHDSSYLSTINLIILCSINVFTLIFYLHYLLTVYLFSNRKKNYRGLLIFILTVFFFIILQVEILWGLKPSLIFNVITLIIPLAILIFFTEFILNKLIRNEGVVSEINSKISSVPRNYHLLIIFFLGIILFIMYVSPFSFNPYLTHTLFLITTIGISIIIIDDIWKIVLRLKKKINGFKIRFNPPSWKYSLVIFITILLANCIVNDLLYQESKFISRGNIYNPTFMTWNIHNAIGTDDVFDLDRVVEDIRIIDPDILLLNEVDRGALKTSFVDILVYIAFKLHMNYYYGSTYYNHYGNAILYKWRMHLFEVQNINLPQQSDDLRSMIEAKFIFGLQDWVIFGTHLSTKESDRLLQIPFIISEIQTISFSTNIIWMGDFNFEPNSIEYSMINGTSSLNFTDTYRFLNSDEGYTAEFNKNSIPQKRIDYIFCSPNLIPLTSYTLCTIASDHCAVITKF